MLVRGLLEPPRERCRDGFGLDTAAPMARNVADVALFLDTMAGLCPRDPLTFEAPQRSFAEAVASPIAPKRVAYTADFGGKVPVDRETREICAPLANRLGIQWMKVELELPMAERIRKGIAYGDVPEDTDVDVLAAYYGAVARGLAVQARDGASRERMLEIVAVAMRAWPSGEARAMPAS